MRVLELIVCFGILLSGSTASASGSVEQDESSDAVESTETSDPRSAGDHYARWVGRTRSELVEYWGQPNKVKRKKSGDVLIYQLRVSCDGMISGTVFKRIGKGVVTGSQDPLNGIENNVPQGATQRAGGRIAAKQTVRFFLDGRRSVSRYEATEAKTNWKRCKY